MFREEGRDCQVWLSSQSRQHFLPFSWSWEIHVIVRLKSRSPGPGLTPGRSNSAAVWYMTSGHICCLCSCSDNHILATWPLDLGQACLFFPQQAYRPGPEPYPTDVLLKLHACLPGPDSGWPWDPKSQSGISGSWMLAGSIDCISRAHLWALSNLGLVAQCGEPFTGPLDLGAWPICCPRRKSTAPQLILSKLSFPNLYLLLKLPVTPQISLPRQNVNLSFLQVFRIRQSFLFGDRHRQREPVM